MTRSKKAEETLKQFYLECALDRGIDLNNRVIVIDEDIEEGLFRWVDAALTQMEKESSRKTITIKINSFGGCVYECAAVIDRIKASSAYIVTECYGKAMSSGMILFAVGDVRKISKHATIMHHEISYEIYDKHNQIKNYVKYIEITENQISNFLEEQTGKPASYWKKLAKDKDAYLTANQAVELNLAHEII